MTKELSKTEADDLGEKILRTILAMAVPLSGMDKFHLFQTMYFGFLVPAFAGDEEEVMDVVTKDAADAIAKFRLFNAQDVDTGRPN